MARPLDALLGAAAAAAAPACAPADPPAHVACVTAESKRNRSERAAHQHAMIFVATAACGSTARRYALHGQPGSQACGAHARRAFGLGRPRCKKSKPACRLELQSGAAQWRPG